jgi:hypothetical protein
MLDHAFARLLRAASVVLIGLARQIRIMFRRATERRRLSELSPVERRDLGLHRVHQELSKWPWEQ